MPGRQSGCARESTTSSPVTPRVSPCWASPKPFPTTNPRAAASTSKRSAPSARARCGARKRLCTLLLGLMFAVASKLAIGAEPGPSATAAGEGANVRLCIDPDWAPYEWLDEQGRHRGIAADLTRLIAARAGLRLSIVQSTSWDESLSLARTGKCDALSFLNETPERAGWLSFTRPYFFDRNVIITRAEHPDIASLADLPAGTMIALPTATSII